MKFYVKIAGEKIEIQSIYDRISVDCKDYIIDSTESDFAILSTEQEIEYELKCEESAGHNYSHFKAEDVSAYLETFSVFRKLADTMIDYNTFLMHGSVVAYQNACFMITGNSGVGKTTRTRLWLDQIPGSYVVNGDKPFLAVRENEVLACGSPWSGKERWNTNTMVPLRAIFLLERAEKTSLQQLTLSEAFVPLLRQTHRPKDPQLMTKTLQLLNQLDGKVLFFRYRSNLDDANMYTLYQTAMDSLPV